MKQIRSLVINTEIINKPDEIIAAQRDFVFTQNCIHVQIVIFILTILILI